MNRFWMITPLLTLGACATTQPKVEVRVVERKVPVAVPCQVTVYRPALALDLSAILPSTLEPQGALLRNQVAVSRGYITDLEAAVIGCGGKVLQEGTQQ